jgi:integrase
MPKIFQRKPDGPYYTRLFKDGGEKWVCLETTSKTEAERRARREAYDAANPLQRETMRAPPVLFSDAWRWYLDSPAGRAMKPHALMQKALIYRKFTAWFKGGSVTDVDKAEAAKFIMEVAATRSPQTARRYLTNLRSTWKAIDYKLRGYNNPWNSVPTIPTSAATTRQFRPFTDNEVETLRKYLAVRNDEWAPMVEIALHTGLRMTDVVHIKGEDCCDGYISVIPEKLARRGRKVLIPLHPAIAPLFEGKTGPLFPQQVKRYDANYTRLSQEFTKILQLLGIVGVDRGIAGFHSLRATFITAMERGGVRRSLVQAIVGHGSPQLTAHYSQDHADQGDISRLNYSSQQGGDRSSTVAEEPQSQRGGIGIRTRLKILGSKEIEGSSPSAGTMSF